MRGQQANFSARPGDWQCPILDCGNINFAWRNDCHNCQAPKPTGARGEPKPNADWQFQGSLKFCFAFQEGDDCSKGQNCQFVHCRKEDQKKFKRLSGQTNSVARSGDWKCPNCCSTNFDFQKDFCYNCKAPKPENSENSENEVEELREAKEPSLATPGGKKV